MILAESAKEAEKKSNVSACAGGPWRPPGGAGRPARAVRWAAVKQAALAGATEDEIVKSLALPREVLQDRETMERLRATIVQAHAEMRVRVRKARMKRALQGSVNLLIDLAPVSTGADDAPDWEDLDGQSVGATREVREGP